MEKSHQRKRLAYSWRCPLQTPFQSSEKALFVEMEQDTAWGGGHVTTWSPIQRSLTRRSPACARLCPWAVPAAQSAGAETPQGPRWQEAAR